MSVALGYVHGNEVAYSWHRSVGELMDRGEVDCFLAVRYGTGGIVEARNQLAADFLAGPEEWLLWTDTDMGFPPDALARLLAHEKPMVGALTFAAMEIAPDGLQGWRIHPAPVLFRWAMTPDGDRQGFSPWLDYPRDELVPVAGTGSAVILVHRTVFEAVRDDVGPNWYAPLRSETTGNVLSEDLAFCARVGRLGIPIHVDTSVKTSHMKTIWLGEPDYPHPGVNDAVLGP